MDLRRLENALRQLPVDTLLTEIPEIQNSIKHLLKSNQEMREYDPIGQDRDLQDAIKENTELMERHEIRIDLTLRVIKERIGDAAAYEVRSNVDAFRKQYPTKTEKKEDDDIMGTKEEGVFL
ncbi:hypothetical protein BDA99DRAFT_506062 [Phascolomyces articulosus]|uniref:Uncharacterized protein n=1 Tax=Phascolomyces articulosus TaxID=60185 RepID=A0AAD5KBX9_9FUNG|nr:hypothetical protein BDA99DRAFT_506062 [Phascolomyces articulosus]